MAVKVNKIHVMLQNKYPQFIGSDADNTEYKILHPFDVEFDKFKSEIQKYYSITDTDMHKVLIWNIDLQKYQKLPVYHNYIKTNGLKSGWDDGSNDQ